MCVCFRADGKFTGMDGCSLGPIWVSLPSGPRKGRDQLRTSHSNCGGLNWDDIKSEISKRVIYWCLPSRDVSCANERGLSSLGERRNGSSGALAAPFEQLKSHDVPKLKKLSPDFFSSKRFGTKCLFFIRKTTTDHHSYGDFSLAC